MFIIKKFILVLITIFIFQTVSKANDVREFEIEGISIGDSLLDYYTENVILENKQSIQYPNEKFIVYNLNDIKDLIQYDRYTITIKKNDKNYIIAGVTGGVAYGNLDECIELKKEFNNEFKKIFPNIIGNEVKYTPIYDKSGKSKVVGTEYSFPSGDVMVANCNDWSDNVKLQKTFQVSMRNEEFSNFLINDAYE